MPPYTMYLSGVGPPKDSQSLHFEMPEGNDLQRGLLFSSPRSWASSRGSLSGTEMSKTHAGEFTP